MSNIRIKNLELWEKRIKEQESSGLSQAAWCREKCICRKNLSRWKSRLTAKSQQTKAPQPSATPFSRVMVVETPPERNIDPVWTAKFLKELFR